MASLYGSSACETTTTEGTGTLSLAGAVAGYRTLVAAIGTGNTSRFRVEAVDADGVPTGEWEEFSGVVTDATPDTVTRAAVLASSTGSAIDFAAGTKRVYCVEPGAHKPFITLTTAADGDFLYRESGVWVNKTTAQVAALVGGLVLIERKVASASASFDFLTGIGDTYDQYELHYGDIVVQTDATVLRLRMSIDGATFEAGASAYQWVREGFTLAGGEFFHTDDADSEIEMGDCGNATNESMHGRIEFPNLRGSRYKIARYQHFGWHLTPSIGRFEGYGALLSATAVNGLQLIAASGQITSGWAALYGVRKS